VIGDKKLEEVTTADIRRFLDGLMTGAGAMSGASRNRYRDLLSGMFKRAFQLGLVPVNPVHGIPKLKESGGRVVFLPPATKERPAHEEEALRDALPPELRHPFTVSVHTGLRWSEQDGLQWRDVEIITGMINVGRSKNGYSRKVPMNATVRSIMVDLGSQRRNPADPREPVFSQPYRTVARAFERAVKRAQEALKDAGKDPSHLDGYTWHCNRHTFASRLAINRVDLVSIQRLGGWRTLAMVQRYAHVADDHLREAVERLDPASAPNSTMKWRENGDSGEVQPQSVPNAVS
jgi:site-specific recombinase XerD